MLNKNEVKEVINLFPDKFSVDDIFEKLILLDKIERAEVQANNNETISESELDLEMEKWFK